MAKRALVLINLGTPDSPSTEDVRRYLGEFLMDPYVIDLPAPMRWALVNGVILRTRPAKSAHAYSKIWTPEGSPLLLHHRALAEKVQEKLQGEWTVVHAFRYGNPTMAAALEKLRSHEPSEIVAFALYPQYSDAATRSSIEKFTAEAKRLFPGIPLKTIDAFYQEPAFIGGFAERLIRTLRGGNVDHVLFSFHGLPERHVKRTAPTHCLGSAVCCDEFVDVNVQCYRAQSFATARAIARKVGISGEKFTVAFQSRLGGTRWIGPYTDHAISELAARGARRIVVSCPSFVADCLETIEEIGIRMRDAFLAAGGEELILVPSLNADSDWADAVSEIARTRARPLA